MIEQHRIGMHLRAHHPEPGVACPEPTPRSGLPRTLTSAAQPGAGQVNSANVRLLPTALEAPGRLSGHYPGGRIEPSADELADLQSLTHPAVYQTPATFDVIAANTAFQRWFPGTRPGANLLEWMLLEPAAKRVFPEWFTDARRLVAVFWALTREGADQQRVAEIVANCERAPEWNELWAAIAADDIGTTRIVVRDPVTRRVRTLIPRFYSPEFPARPWWLCRLVPDILPR